MKHAPPTARPYAGPVRVVHGPRAAAVDGLFVPLHRQRENLRQWSADLEWGFPEAALAALDVTAEPGLPPLVVDVLVPYLHPVFLGDAGTLDGVRRTCDELWWLAEQQQPSSWCWDELREPGGRKPVRLLPGQTHEPGVRRVRLDLAAHWQPGSHVRPVAVRGPDSAHAEVLAAAAHFPYWVRAMNGRTVPHACLAGYQVTHPPAGTDARLPVLTWTTFRQAVSLAVEWADHSQHAFACPVRIE